MSDLPNDLIPLPTAPYDTRPPSMPLDIEECRTAIWLARGNITGAAKMLKVNSNRLRAFVKQSKYLTAEVDEAKEMLVDIAEANVYDALTDEDDAARRDQMSRFVLNSIGRKRGYGTNPGGQVNLNTPKGRIVVEWGDGSSIQDNDVVDLQPNKDGTHG